MSAARRSRRRLLVTWVAILLVTGGLAGGVTAASDASSGETVLLTGGLLVAGGVPLLVLVLHPRTDVDTGTRRRLAILTRLMSGSGALAAVAGAALATASTGWTLAVAVYAVLLTGALARTHSHLDRLRDDESEVTVPLDAEAQRRQARRVLVTGLVVALPVAGTLVTVPATLGELDARGLLVALTAGGFLGGLAGGSLGAFSQGPALRGPVDAVGGDGPRFRRLRRVALGADASGEERAAAVPLARALLALQRRQAPSGVAVVVAMASAFLLQLGRQVPTPWALTATGAAFLVFAAITLLGVRERRLLSRFLAQHDPDHQHDPDAAR